MQCKDIETVEILRYLADRQGRWTMLWGPECTLSEPYDDVYKAMPIGTPYKLALAKMKKLKTKGLVDGCTCGCRGDFEITNKGLRVIECDISDRDDDDF